MVWLQSVAPVLSLKENMSCYCCKGLARCCRQVSGLQSTATNLQLLVLQSGAGAAVVWVNARTQTCLWPLGRGGYVEGHSILCAGSVFSTLSQRQSEDCEKRN